MPYQPAARNREHIQHAELRQQVDAKYEALHDALSAAYYERRPFVWKGRDYGLLDKATFDKLHGLVFHHRDVEFHAENQKRPAARRYAEGEYNAAEDDAGRKTNKHEQAAARIAALAAEGIELEI